MKPKHLLLNKISWLYIIILILLPFHAFLTTWAGGTFGHIDMWRIWKELLIFATVPVVAYVAVRSEGYMRWLRRTWLLQLVMAYILLYAISGAFALHAHTVNASALVYSLLSNLRFLGFFLLVTVVAAHSPVLRRYAPRAVILAGAVVVGFGLLQLVLPYDFLAHFGYGPDTIPAFHTVDNKLDYQRIQSTLRGPNPLGAYLVVIIGMLVALWRLALHPFSWKFWGYMSGTAVVLLFSYSRSAYIGAVVTVAVIVLVALSTPKFRRYLAVGLCAMVVVCAGALFALRNNDAVQNTFFHSDEHSASSESSNAGRRAALQNGLHDVATEPFGLGPGTAGPASTRNDQPARIAENYFIQIGQEVGWLGIALFVAINIVVARLLWQRRREWLSLGLLAALVGLTVVNLVSHAWADDTLGLLWWGLAGIAVASGIMEQKANKHSKKYNNNVPTSKKRKTRS
jgi:hypothetical protein